MRRDALMTDLLVDRVRLHRQGDSNAIVLVEGTPDKRLLQNADIPNQAFPVGPRYEVLAALADVLAAGLGPAVALVDRDFDELVTESIASGLPVVAYGDADLESMLWNTEVLERLLEQEASLSKLEAYGGIDAVRTSVDEIILPLQRLRAANAAMGLGISFRELDLRTRIGMRSLEMSVAGLCARIHTANPDIATSELIAIATSYDLPNCPETGRPLVRGKDRLGALGVALRHVLDGLSHAMAEAETMAHLAYPHVRRSCVARDPWFLELLARIEG